MKGCWPKGYWPSLLWPLAAFRGRRPSCGKARSIKRLMTQRIAPGRPCPTTCSIASQGTTVGVSVMSAVAAGKQGMSCGSSMPATKMASLGISFPARMMLAPNASRKEESRAIGPPCGKKVRVPPTAGGHPMRRSSASTVSP